LVLVWCQLLQDRDLGEKLNDEDKDIEILRQRRRDDISPPPTAGQFSEVKRVNCQCQYDQREDADRMRGHKVFGGEGKAGHACRHGRKQKDCGPAAEMLARKPAKDDDEARENPHEADDDVNEDRRGKSKYHRVVSFESSELRM